MIVKRGNCIINSTAILTVSAGHVEQIQAQKRSLEAMRPIEIDDEELLHALNVELEPYDKHT